MATKLEMAEWIEAALRDVNRTRLRCGPLGMADLGKPASASGRELELPDTRTWITVYAATLNIPVSLAEKLDELHQSGVPMERIVEMLRNDQI